MSKKVGNKMYINIEKVAKLVNDKKCDAIILFNESNIIIYVHFRRVRV